MVRYCAESSRHREMQMGTADARTCSPGAETTPSTDARRVCQSCRPPTPSTSTRLSYSLSPAASARRLLADRRWQRISAV